MKYLFSVQTGLFITAAQWICMGLNFAATPPAPDIWEDHLVHPFDAIVLTEQQIDRFLLRLSESNPARAAELEKIRITQPRQFRWEIREEMSNRFFQRIIPPVETEPESPAAPVQPASVSDAALARHEELVAWLAKSFPQQAKELQINPMLSEARINELRERYEPIMRAERSNPPLAETMKDDIATQMRCDELLMELPYADPPQREDIINEIKILTAKRFDLIVLKRRLQHEFLQNRLEQLRQELEKQRQEIESLKNSKNYAVEERVRELIERADQADWN